MERFEMARAEVILTGILPKARGRQAALDALSKLGEVVYGTLTVVEQMSEIAMGDKIYEVPATRWSAEVIRL
jgi:hypothetical protein